MNFDFGSLVQQAVSGAYALGPVTTRWCLRAAMTPVVKNLACR